MRIIYYSNSLNHFENCYLIFFVGKEQNYFASTRKSVTPQNTSSKVLSNSLYNKPGKKKTSTKSFHLSFKRSLSQIRSVRTIFSKFSNKISSPKYCYSSVITSSNSKPSSSSTILCSIRAVVENCEVSPNGDIVCIMVSK
jgi:hypothetical protein